MTQKEKLEENLATLEKEVDRIVASITGYVKEEIDRMRDLIDEMEDEDEDNK